MVVSTEYNKDVENILKDIYDKLSEWFRNRKERPVDVLNQIEWMISNVELVPNWYDYEVFSDMIQESFGFVPSLKFFYDFISTYEDSIADATSDMLWDYIHYFIEDHGKY